MKTLLQILYKPAVLAVATAVALVAALVSDESGDVMGWIGLAYVCGVGLYYAFRRRRPT
jgi:hypothetical protein